MCKKKKAFLFVRLLCNNNNFILSFLQGLRGSLHCQKIMVGETVIKLICRKFFPPCCHRWLSHYTDQRDAEILHFSYFPSYSAPQIRCLLLMKEEGLFMRSVRLLSVNISPSIYSGMSLAAAFLPSGCVFPPAPHVDEDKHWCCLLVSRCQHRWCHWYPL